MSSRTAARGRPAAAVALAFIVAAAPAAALDPSVPGFRSEGEPAALARAIVADMDDAEALAQTFMLGWVGADPSPLVIKWVRERKLGGIKIFGWNTDDTARLARAVAVLQEAALDSPRGIPLFVATDQEGGWIRHVKGSTAETPGNMAIGASGFPRDAYLSGYYIAKEIAELGINMNFAPTVDILTNADSVVIGPRAFGDDPARAAVLGAAFAKGTRKAGVIATAKHFPGHGATELDSHGILPYIDDGFDVLWERELVPYRLLAKEGVDAIMSGHLAFPRTPAGNEPASLSPWFLKDVLRGKIGFKGLVVTDDLMMNGAAAYSGSLSRAAKRAMEAGNDVLMLSKTPELDDPIWTALLDACRRDPAFRSRVRDAAERVVELKLKRLRGPDAPPFAPDPAKADGGAKKEAAAFFAGLAARSATAVKGGGLPLSEPGRVLLAGSFDAFFAAGSAAYPSAAAYKFSYAASGAALREEAAELARRAEGADTVVFCLANASGAEMLKALRGRGKTVVVVSVLSPVYLERAAWADASVAVYSYSGESFAAAFSAISGSIAPTGRLPFVLRERG